MFKKTPTKNIFLKRIQYCDMCEKNTKHINGYCSVCQIKEIEKWNQRKSKKAENKS